MLSGPGPRPARPKATLPSASHPGPDPLRSRRNAGRGRVRTFVPETDPPGTGRAQTLGSEPRLAGPVTRIALLGLLAAAASAQELPLIRAAGTSLDTFEIELRLDAVDHGTPEGLAKAFARFEEEQHGVRRVFAEMVRDEHLALMRRFYGKELVDRQLKAYDAIEQKGYRCEVTGITGGSDNATAQERRTYVEGGKQREETSEIGLVRNGRRWEIAAIRDRAPGGKLVERGLGTPPVLAKVPLPAPEAPDLSSPRAAVSSLRVAILRFGALRDNASLALTDRFFDILGAFYGEETVRKARAERPKVEAPTRLSTEIGDGAPRLADLVRVEVVLSEEVPGRTDLKSAIANAAFDLRPEGGTWRVVSEHVRLDPEHAYSPVTRDFALFFLVRR